MPKGGTRTSADMSGGELNGDFFEHVFDGVVCEEAFFFHDSFIVRVRVRSSFNAGSSVHFFIFKEGK